MTELRLLDAATGVARLRETGARGFLNLDPVTQNDPLLIKHVTRMNAQLGTVGDTVVGWAQNDAQPRQAMVATTSDDPDAVAAVVDFLTKYQRCTSFVAFTTEEIPFSENGFREIGTLPQHVFAGGAYHDVKVYFAGKEDA